MRTIVFDMMGFVAGSPSGYPGLEGSLVRHLSRTSDIEIGLWTKDFRESYKFRDWASFFVGKEDIRDFGIAVQERDKKLLSEICRQTKLKEDLVNLEELMPRWNKWESTGGVIFDGKKWAAFHKYPPLLGNECSILIESDLGRIDNTGKIKRESWLSDEALEFARNTHSSIILVPEYPNIWEEGKCLVQPNEVLDYLKDILLNWQGEEIQRDLGVEMGIYTKEGR